MRRLFLDIETSPNVGLFWEPGYNVTLSSENIIKERAIICIGWKWAGEGRVLCPTWDKKQDDKKLLEEFIPVLHEADEVVAHYGTKFDLPWIRARAMRHGLSMSHLIQIQDTKNLAAKWFKFNANNLNYLAQFLGLGEKVPTTYGLWRKVLLDRDPKALAKMVRYCKQDVRLLEKVWDRMQSYVPAKSHATGFAGECPECGSSMLVVSKRRMTAAGSRRVQVQCKDCGKYHSVAATKWERAVA